MIFGRVKTPTLRGQITEQIREAILHGQLKAGERIVERTLAAQFGASLTAIREAIITLETEGFVTKKPNTSTCITQLTAEDVESIFEVRLLLEPYVVAKAAQLATAEQRSNLEEAYLEMVDAARHGDLRAYVARDYAWHAAVWAVVGNEYLQTVLQRVTVPLFSYSSIRFSEGGAFDLLNDATSHSALLEQIKAGNAEGARECTEKALKEWHASIRAFAHAREAVATKKSSQA
jgi:DNA-binding GntR family transcriptional regulator